MTNETADFEIHSRQTFIEFIEQLRRDFIENPDSWENKTLPDFLEAISAYAEDIQGYYDNTQQNINANEASWKLFADIFKGATMYE
ncbi:hypothetical protein ACLOAU_09245 [Niabella sp. CJ426]|uniref:DUF7660 family protein n=1 Tax=Niabella sp. CJ426 TaxID=3393740 RepID=UPI003D0868D0